MSVHEHYCPLLHGNNPAHNAIVTVRMPARIVGQIISVLRWMILKHM